MHRRNFLYNAGLLVPAIMLSPSNALASKKTIDAGILIIEDIIATTIFNKLSIPVFNLHTNQISGLVYTDDGFWVTTNDNDKFLAQKIVVNATYTITSSRSSIKINALDIAFDRPDNQNKTTPEFWFIQPATLDAARAGSLIQRTGHALFFLPV